MKVRCMRERAMRLGVDRYIAHGPQHLQGQVSIIHYAEIWYTRSRLHSCRVMSASAYAPFLTASKNYEKRLAGARDGVNKEDCRNFRQWTSGGNQRQTEVCRTFPAPFRPSLEFANSIRPAEVTPKIRPITRTALASLPRLE